MSSIQIKNARVDPVTLFHKFHTMADVLRLDLVHPVVSGNKWFKLKEYIREAQEMQKKTIVTFGGAFSNHIVATAAAADACGLQSMGVIRGERPAVLSPALKDAMNYGMELFFISREAYRDKQLPVEIAQQYRTEDLYLINEGGYGLKGAQGAGDILKQVAYENYSFIVAAVGTGTMLAGLTSASYKEQKITGISVLKNNFSLQGEISALISPEDQERFSLIHEYHFGGYAKHNKMLISFMNEWYSQTNIPTDFVYTGKLFFAVNDLVQKNYFPGGSRLLLIHSGGLQGNWSLPKGTLIF